MRSEHARVLVAGAGALGSVVGGMLAAAGHRVTLLGRHPHLAAIAHDGLAIDGLWGERRVRNLTLASGVAELEGRFASILLTVKSYDTAAMLAQVRDALDPEGCLLSMQNGLGNVEQVLASVGAARALGARVIFGAEISHPGAVRVTVSADPVAVGAVVPGTARAEAQAAAWVERLSAAGIATVRTRDLGAELWTKVFYNAALNPLGALFALPYGALAADADARAIMDAVIGEAWAVAAARGVSPSAADVDSYRRTFYERLVPATAHHRSSMLQDLTRGRATEIEAINGCVWRYGHQAGVATPVNATLTRLIRWRARLGRGEAGAPC